MYNKNKHIHFMGIGGIGMSGIALLLREQGYTVSGCDLDIQQKSVQSLMAKGCAIYHGNNTPQCLDDSIDILVYSTDILIYSATHTQKNPEIIAAQKRNIPVIHRSLMLAELMRTKYSIAVSGSHGKTTTTSLLSHILMTAQTDPSVIIGGYLKNLQNNARAGSGPFLVAEADESDRSFLNLRPSMTIVTNIDLEHLETYKDLADIKEAFKKFIEIIPFYGKAILCADNEHVRSLLPEIRSRYVTYGIEHGADFSATDISLEATHSNFTVLYQGAYLGSVSLAIPGYHNILNSLAAISASHALQIPFETIKKALASFAGVERRFSFRGTFKNAELFEDYGHHPEEIKQTIQMARKRSKNKLTVVLQPHRYTRTHKLWDLFIETLLHAPIDNLIITDIYPANEAPIDQVNSEKLTIDLLAKNPSFNLAYVPYEVDFESMKSSLSAVANKDDLILLLGAGSINKLIDFL
ncbi:MAG: UDP-N-acetylmuramate--L-alanine ligase [Candidatus Dependentiae bacterium]|nr:UDP-N-acetylmuramate--L-alanine ligase [Candidatus Dependentiae bacterium]